MAKSTILNVPVHTIGTETTFQVSLPLINWAGYAKMSETPEKVELTSKDAPIDTPLRMSRGITQIKNIYSGTGIDVAYQRPYRRGVSFITALDCSATTTDTDFPNYRVDTPFHAHLVIRAPVSGDFSAALVLDAMRYLLAAMFDQTDPTNSDAVGDPLRGILLPIGMQTT